MDYPRIVLADTTSAAISEEFYTVSNNQIIAIQCMGLTGTEKATLEMKDWQKGTWSAVQMSGVNPIFDIGNNLQFVRGPIAYRVNKEASAASVGVNLFSIMSSN